MLCNQNAKYNSHSLWLKRIRDGWNVHFNGVIYLWILFMEITNGDQSVIFVISHSVRDILGSASYLLELIFLDILKFWIMFIEIK